VAAGREDVDDETVVVLRCDGTFDAEIKGESHYQDAIRACVAGTDLEATSDDACSCEFSVRLVREPQNAYDANAVAVRSRADETLGYLPREVAHECARVLDQIGSTATVECAARAYGRRDGSRSPWNFGIWLDLPDTTQLAAALGELASGAGGVISGRGVARDRGDGTRESLIAESCPVCGATTLIAPGLDGFRCRSCQNDIWFINCHDCHKETKVYGSVVGSGAIGFDCEHCGTQNVVDKRTLREINADVRRAERAAAGKRREAALADKQSRETKAIRETGRVQAQFAALNTLLTSTAGESFSFDRLKVVREQRSFNPGALVRAEQEPVIDDFLPPAPQGFRSLLPGAARKHREQLEQADRAFAEACEQHEAREAQRLEALNLARDEFDAKTAELEATTRRQHADVDQLEARFRDGDPAAVAEYYAVVLGSMSFPYERPEEESRVAFAPESRQLAIELELPPLEVVPDVREYRYIKSRDEVKPMAVPAAERRRVYASLIAQVALAVLRAAFEADTHDVVETIVLNGHVHTIDPRTGQRIHPCLVTVRATRERFSELNLAHVDPAACLKGLNASISRSPGEMVPVRPVLDFDMVDLRFVARENVLETLDTRPNLMELTPQEFESLITDLFEKMGLETRLTRPSRDGGVDCVAYDARPILGGKVVIQAKRYKNTVGVSAVRDLFGTVHNEGASKGILVTTSGYGQASHEFANGKPLELLDGGNLLSLLQEHAGIEAKIVFPDDWVDPGPDA
jgi:restriction system protein